MMIKPSKICIPGDYIDCFIYKGRLYLWTFNGDIEIYNWDELIDSIFGNEKSKLAASCAFCRGDYLYNPDFSMFFENREIKDTILNQFGYLSNSDIILDKSQMEAFLRGRQENPTKELPVDLGIYKNKLYTADQTGIYSLTTHRPTSNKYQVSTRPEKLCDCPSFSIQLGNCGNIAISAGNEGLFEYLNNDALPYHHDSNLERISASHSSFSNWAFSSIYSSSLIESSYLAPRIFKETAEYTNFSNDEYSNNFVSTRIINEQEIFGEKGILSWACNEKFYQYNHGKIGIVNFTQSKLSEGVESAFSSKKEILLDDWKGRVIASNVSSFGTIIECENAIVVLLSTGEQLVISDRVVNWRVYPKSIRYENHLHIIKDDSIDILSFNHDYFVDQKSKNYGIKHYGKMYHNRRLYAY